MRGKISQYVHQHVHSQTGMVFLLYKNILKISFRLKAKTKHFQNKLHSKTSKILKNERWRNNIPEDQRSSVMLTWDLSLS